MLRPTDIFGSSGTAKAGSYVGLVCGEIEPERLVLARAGKFDAVAGAIEQGMDPGWIETYDDNLFSAVVGYYVDPNKDPRDLDLSPDEQTSGFFGKGAENDPLEYAASVLLAMKYAEIRPLSRYLSNLRREIATGRDRHMDRLKRQLTRLYDRLAGISYEVAGPWEVMEILESREDLSGVYWHQDLSVPEPGDERALRDAEKALSFRGQAALDPEDAPEFFDRLDGLRERGMVATVHASPKTAGLSNGWQPVAVFGDDPDSAEKVYANFSPRSRHAAINIPKRNPMKLEIYNEQEITEDSTLRYIPVDADTALYYRDLFIHQKGSTQAEAYYLLLLDDRVIHTTGLHVSALFSGTSDYVYETFGITISSKRYGRLNKLPVYCIVSRDMRDMLVSQNRAMRLRSPKGVKSAELRDYKDTKSNRRIFEVYNSRPFHGGRTLISIKAEFKDYSWREALKIWLEEWGGVKRAS